MNIKFLSIIIFLIILISVSFLFFSQKNKDDELNTMSTEENKMQENTRSPAVSGSFYPDEKNKLIKIIEKNLNNATKTTALDEQVLGLIAPHAGYIFSGETAGFSFKQVENEKYDTVILIGSSHTTFFKGASVYKEGFYQTPLGNIPIDEEISNKLLKNSKINYKPSVHKKEHSIEVELPFLQKSINEEFSIVPIIIGGGEGEEIVSQISNTILEIIKESGKKILVVASSDLSHYPNYKDAVFADNKTLNAIESGNVDTLRATIKDLQSKKLLNIETFACGQRAIEVLMKIMKELGADNIEILNYTNSGDTAGNKERVVGYGAVVFKKIKNEDFSTISLNSEEKEFLLNLAKNTTEKYILGEIIETPEKIPEKLKNEQGAFVTLKKDGELRGCIGAFEPKQPLWKVVQQMAISACSEDKRFKPVSKEELPKIKYEISVLTPLKKIESLDEIELGVHGVKIEKSERSGVFLPSVAIDTGWSFEHFMNEICTQKMSLEKNCYKSPDAQIYIFKTENF